MEVNVAGDRNVLRVCLCVLLSPHTGLEIFLSSAATSLIPPSGLCCHMASAASTHPSVALASGASTIDSLSPDIQSKSLLGNKLAEDMDFGLFCLLICP